MITDYFMREPLWVHGQSILDVILHETLLTFNLKMILWNLSLAVLGALVGFFCGRTKQAKKALREVEGKYQELAESISDVFFAMDNNLRYTYWNKASEILTGIPAEKAVGKTLMEVFPDNEAREQVKKMYLRVIETKKPEHLIVTYPGNEQIVHEINTYPTREGVSIFINDITSRNQAEEALRESEERYRILFESSRDAIMTLAPPTWLFTSGNPATIELFCKRQKNRIFSPP